MAEDAIEVDDKEMIVERGTNYSLFLQMICVRVRSLFFSINSTFHFKEEKQKAEASWDGRAILVLPRPAMPEAPLASPRNNEVGAHENKKHETTTFFPGLKPLVDWMDKTSSASSPRVMMCVMVLSGMRLQVLLQQGFGDEKQSSQLSDLAREHWAEGQRAGRYVEELYWFSHSTQRNLPPRSTTKFSGTSGVLWLIWAMYCSVVALSFVTGRTSALGLNDGIEKVGVMKNEEC